MPKRKKKLLRLISATISPLLLLGAFAGNASAAIIFQDDTFHEIVSEGILIDANGTGADTTSIQFGNDAVSSENGTITWDITNNQFLFNNSINVSGAATVADTLDVNGAVFLGDNGDGVTIDSNTWDITAAGVGSGFTGFTSTGVVNFSGSSSFRIREEADEATADCTTVNEIIIDTTEKRLYVCTATGTPGTWTAVSGANQDFEAIYANDGDNTLTTGNGDFTINTGTGDFIFTGSNASLDASGNLSVAGDITVSGNDLVFGNGESISNATDGSLQFNGNITFNTDNVYTIGDATNAPADIYINNSAGNNVSLNDVGVSNSTSGASAIGIFDEFDNSNATNVQDVLDDLDAAITAASGDNEVMIFYPEYPDTVIFQDGTDNRGMLEALYDDTNDEHYYEWTSTRSATQDIDVKFRYPLPSDFLTTGDFTFRYRTGTTTEADNDVEVYIYNATNETAGNPTLCASDTTNTSANAWTTGTITAASINSGCTGGTALDAGDIVEVTIKLYDNSGSADFADVGYLIHDY